MRVVWLFSVFKADEQAANATECTQVDLREVL